MLPRPESRQTKSALLAEGRRLERRRRRPGWSAEICSRVQGAAGTCSPAYSGPVHQPPVHSTTAGADWTSAGE